MTNAAVKKGPAVPLSGRGFELFAASRVTAAGGAAFIFAKG